MNYSNIYNSLIDRARTRTISQYVEKHHIVPKCIGGDDTRDNIVSLTPEEHYLAHQLLVKIHPYNNKLVYAAHSMTFDRLGRRYNNKLYGWLRKKVATANSEKMKGGVSNFKGRKHTDDTKSLMSQTSKALGLKPPTRQGIHLTIEQKKHLSDFWKGKPKPPRTEEHAEKIAIKLRGSKASEDTRAKLSLLRTGKSFDIVACPHCNVSGGSSAMGRWHFNNCRYKLTA